MESVHYNLTKVVYIFKDHTIFKKIVYRNIKEYINYKHMELPNIQDLLTCKTNYVYINMIFYFR